MRLDSRDFDREKVVTQCEIDGEIRGYRGCGSDSLEKAKAFYAEWEYIGSSHVYFINGTRNYSTELLHFFN